MHLLFYQKSRSVCQQSEILKDCLLASLLVCLEGNDVLDARGDIYRTMPSVGLGRTHTVLQRLHFQVS